MAEHDLLIKLQVQNLKHCLISDVNPEGRGEKERGVSGDSY